MHENGVCCLQQVRLGGDKSWQVNTFEVADVVCDKLPHLLPGQSSVEGMDKKRKKGLHRNAAPAVAG